MGVSSGGGRCKWKGWGYVGGQLLDVDGCWV